jgi:hypothetical protein
MHIVVDVDEATGLLWQDTCTGPMKTKGFVDFRNVEPNFPSWAKYNRNWAARAAKGPYVSGGPEGTRTVYFYNGAFQPYGSSWGGPFAPTKKCEPLPPSPPPCDGFFIPCESFPPGPSHKNTPVPRPTKAGGPAPAPSASPRP